MAKYKKLDIRIDPEFESLIDPLTDEEYNQLKENIHSDGLTEKIKIWNEPGKNYYVIVDGHNRNRILKELSEEEPEECWLSDDKYEVLPFVLSTREEVKDYIIRNQVGRRNLTREQTLRLIGKMHTNRKKTHGGNRGNQFTAEAKGHGEPLAKTTAQQIAEEFGISESTVKRADKFSNGIDAIEKISKEAANKVLKGKAGVRDTDVANFPKLNPEEQKDFVELIVNPDKKAKKPKAPDTFVDVDYTDIYTGGTIAKAPQKYQKTYLEFAKIYMEHFGLAAMAIDLFSQACEGTNDPGQKELFGDLSDMIARGMWYFHTMFGIPLGDHVEIAREHDKTGEERYRAIISYPKG